MQPYQTNERDIRAMALKALAVVGFIAILIFGAWGLIQVARMLPSFASALSSAAVSLSSIFVPSERLEITIPSANAFSGQPFTLSWTHENKRADGSYTVTFACRDGLTVEVPSQSGTYQKVFCNTPFNLTNETSSMKLVFNSEKSRFLDVPLKLTFTRLSDGEVVAETETSVTVTNEKLSDTAVIPTPTTPATPTVTPGAGTGVRPGTPSRNTYVVTTAGRVSDPNGRPDLVATILDTGVIDPSTNVYTKTSSISRQNRGAVRFVIENRGTKTVDRFTFNAVLPTMPMHIFSSDMQPVLGPGDKIEYTLGFDQVDGAATQNTVTINVDPANSVWNEVSENNNIAKVILTITN